MKHLKLLTILFILALLASCNENKTEKHSSTSTQNSVKEDRDNSNFIKGDTWQA